MAGAEDGAAGQAAEIIEMVRQLRERVRARHPETAGGEHGVRLADLMPLVHARDAAQAKVAAIGTVNPRPPGLLNHLVQALKRGLARLLDWHVREQVEFNRAIVDAVNAAIEAMNETNRGLEETAAAGARQYEDLRGEMKRWRAELDQALAEQRDIRTHWQQWRPGWEEKLATNEIQFLRSVADLQASFQHRVTQIEGNFRDLVRAQHDDFTTALEKSGLAIQQRLWRDLDRIREDYERLIHNELRLLRQRGLARAPAPLPPAGGAGPAPAPTPGAAAIDELHFADRFRGREDEVKRKMAFYVDWFRGAPEVLDLGCGRGEFLEVMQEAGIPAQGVDRNEEFVARCRAKKLRAEQADLFAYLDSLADGSLGGINCTQVVEHLPPARLPELIRLMGAKLERGGRLAVETPNPECLAIFASHFYLDPTHTHPVPPALLVFHLEEAGFGAIQVHALSPAAETMPSLAELPEAFRKEFFGGLDYAVLAKKL